MGDWNIFEFEFHFLFNDDVRANIIAMAVDKGESHGSIRWIAQGFEYPIAPSSYKKRLLRVCRGLSQISFDSVSLLAIYQSLSTTKTVTIIYHCKYRTLKQKALRLDATFPIKS